MRTKLPISHIIEMSATMRRCQFIFFLLLPILICGCMKRSLTQAELQELLSVSPRRIGAMQYVFEGNSAGYAFIARIEASEEVVRDILAGMTPCEDVGADDPEFRREWRQGNFLRTGVPFPKWLDVPWTSPLEVWEESSANSLSTFVTRSCFYDRERGVLYISEGGI